MICSVGSVHVALGVVDVDGDWEVPFPLAEALAARPLYCWVLALYVLASHEGLGKPLPRGR